VRVNGVPLSLCPGATGGRAAVGCLQGSQQRRVLTARSKWW